MNAIRRIVFTIIVLSILVPETSTKAYFKDLGVGARPLGMGGAYVAAADDGNAIFWNAAGLAQLEKQEITAMFADLYTGLEPRLYNEKTDQLGYHFLGYVYPSRVGSFAISWSTFQSQIYDESTFCLSYGGRLNKHLYTGMNLKRPGWKIGWNEYTRLDKDITDNGTSRSGFTLDIGALYKATDRFSVGFSAENLLPADVGLNTKENIPINLRGGIAYKMYNPADLDMQLLSLFDVTYRMRDGTNIRMGMEGWFLKESAGVRAGWNLTSATLGLSYRIARKWLETQIDYAFIYPLSIRETYGSHRMSISVRL